LQEGEKFDEPNDSEKQNCGAYGGYKQQLKRSWIFKFHSTKRGTSQNQPSDAKENVFDYAPEDKVNDRIHANL